MKRAIIWLFIGGVLGSAAGFAAGIFAYPYIFLADVVATERVENIEDKTVLARGQFIHANPSDPIHYGEGPGHRVRRCCAPWRRFYRRAGSGFSCISGPGKKRGHRYEGG